MNRRSFIGLMLGGVAATAAVRTWPFRVFSFPSEVTIASPLDFYKLMGELYLQRPNMVGRIDNIETPTALIHPEHAKYLEGLFGSTPSGVLWVKYPNQTWNNLKRSAYPLNLKP
jgi:hypothetical protein